MRAWTGNAGTAGNLANGDFSGVVGTLIGTNAPQGGYYGVAGSTALPAGIGTLSQRTLRNGCDRIAIGLYNPALAASQTNIPTRCFPENYLAANPQLNNATYNTNLGRSNYHALQVQFSLRPTAGFSFQSTYSWAKSMQVGGTFTDPLMRDLDRQRGQEGPHSFRMNGTVELPFGPNKLLFANTSGWVARLIERWQTSFILNLASGSPLNVSRRRDMRYDNGRFVATEFWNNPKGHVEWNGPGNNSGTFFGFNQYVGAPDPQCGNPQQVVQTDSRGFNFAGQCSIDALAFRVPAGTPGSYELTPGDPASTVVNMLVNPAPGQLGTLGFKTLDYWGQFNFDANIQKTFRLTESKQLSHPGGRYEYPEPPTGGRSECGSKQFRNNHRRQDGLTRLPGAGPDLVLERNCRGPAMTSVPCQFQDGIPRLRNSIERCGRKSMTATRTISYCCR